MQPDPRRFDVLEATAGHVFSNRELLEQVFTHRSYVNEHKSLELQHNERLEFLGDAVLELVSTEFLYRTYPNPEGELTTWRSALVKGEMLSEVARELGFSDLLRLSRGEARSGGREKGYLLANALEAFIGALYLEAGYARCQEFLGSVLLCRLPGILENALFIDPKSRLQEILQDSHGSTPTYEIVSEEGPDHAKVFTAALRVQGTTLGLGTGSSKQAAQVDAARSVLEEITGKQAPAA